MSNFWAQSYEKATAQRYANEFMRGEGDLGFDRNFYERYYPGYTGRVMAVKAMCVAIREAVNAMALDVSAKEARSLNNDFLRGRMIDGGLLPADIPNDLWITLLKAELVSVFLARRKDYVFHDAADPEFVVEGDDQWMIINDEPAKVNFVHKEVPIYMAVMPMFTYPLYYLMMGDGNTCEHTVKKQRYFAVIDGMVYEDSTKAGIIKIVNRVLRERDW